MAWENPQQLGADVWVTQIVMLLSDLIVHAALGDRGIQPDLVFGHSYGEFAALTAAGVWDLDAVITAARARYDGIEATPSAYGTMMATTAPPELIERLAATLPDRAYPANYNAPDQTVLGGRPETLKALAALLDSNGHKSQLLPVPCPFHTPLMAGAGSILKQTLQTLRLRALRVPFVSSVTNRFVAEPDEIRANLAAQLTTPVRWVDLVQRIAGEGETVFVEVGPQQALSKLNRRILEGRGAAGIIACDNPKRAGIEQLLHVQALLECLGALGRSEAPQPQRVAPLATQSAPNVAQAAPAELSGVKPRQGHSHARRRDSTSPRKNARRGQKGWPTLWVERRTGNSLADRRQRYFCESCAACSDLGQGQRRSASFAEWRPWARAPPPRHVATSAVALSRSPVVPHVSYGAAPAVGPSPAARSAPAQPAAVATAAAPTAPKQQVATKPGGPAPAELEKFLINFVVEQTGYPAGSRRAGCRP